MSNQRVFFGTDGIRGTANSDPMTVEVAQKLGQAVGLLFMDEGDQRRHQVLIGKDTRLSGYMIESALIAGFLSAGMDVIVVGPMPTPAIAMLTRSLRADLGVMISASHNPYYDNGIKIFDRDGFKLSDAQEIEIERLIQSDLSHRLAGPEHIGRAVRLDDAAGRYIEHAKASFPRQYRLNGLKIAIDCANGAAYKVAPAALWELGAEVISLGCKPNGFNINKNCGSTHPEALCQAVIEHQADIGIALDGDADRMLLVDETGKVLDGDQILAVIASSWAEKGYMPNKHVVATIMSNMGLERFFKSQNIELLRTQVGDRYVVEKMRELGCIIGGEQSGHMILSNFSTTGDGLIAALQVLAVLVERKEKASVVCNKFSPFPQELRNIRFQGSDPLTHENVQNALREAEEQLGKDGRIILRKSGTEPLIRVMAEAEDYASVDRILTHLCDVIQNVKDC
ncbi:Phosphomannomutase (ManB) (PDB:6MNV) [Commensalibacter communis]|uniref:phosphoglucosamine mutase n=1 Tax=Commensalibacter communis TaxID=2972786 RepID=UPI0022FFA38E|nr:phosphoglucosamine mutase [Commensalibacter communis]CAI3928032.1 Phosphomannomutase (ManB) (PDB:6MNV) [Commensalibacter communis]CAI3931164.1 Phosphomannomutase (ManB) (PDB:6MNV) [Commensalibacter communis]